MMPARFWALSVVAAAGAGLLAASTMTFLDWRLNPGGLFQSPDGTRWDVVWQTWISWFLPVAAAVLVIGLPLALLAARRR